MVDVVLDKATPDDEALKSPERRRWCEGIHARPSFAEMQACSRYQRAT